MKSGKLILVRHGLSVYNDQNRFTGWKDVDLNEQGVAEAKQAVNLLEDVNFDMAFTSKLKRANDTLGLILKGIGQESIHIEKDLALNERDYGDLVGQNKAEAAKKFGDEQVQIWRRSYDIPPPGGESLKDTADRVIPYLNEKILPRVYAGENIIVSAHGNSIRSIVMHLLSISQEEVLKTEIGWCEPWIFEFDNLGKVVDVGVHTDPDRKSDSYLPKKYYVKK